MPTIMPRVYDHVMIRLASVWHGRDGYTLKIHDVKARAWLEEQVTDAVCKLSRGWACPLCLCCRCDWAFRVGWGGRDDDGTLRRSLGHFLWRLGQRGWLDGAREAFSCPLTFEQVCESFPDCRQDDDDDGVSYRRGVMIDAVGELPSGHGWCDDVRREEYQGDS